MKGLRVVLLDLLVERAEFGYGGNIEILSPIANNFPSLDVWLLNPQFQSDELGESASSIQTPIIVNREDLPTWNEDFPFVSQYEPTELSGDSKLTRVALPFGDDEAIKSWLIYNDVDVVICSGSRRNVSMWEKWMDNAASLLRGAVNLGLPTLGICFGHQLLCKALGGEVLRAAERTDMVHNLELSEHGLIDPLFTGLISPVCLFTHQDHVVKLPDCVKLLGTAPHNSMASVRVCDGSGKELPIWGVQFHPEAAKNRIERSVRLGHITASEAKAFEREHDGAHILTNFANEVARNIR